MMRWIKKLNLELLFQMLLPLFGGLLIYKIIPSANLAVTGDPFLKLPPLAFAIVWPILYLLMGYSAYRAEFENGEKVLWPYYLSLVLNFAWMPLFFGFKQPLLAFIDLIALFAIVVYTFIRFYKIDKKAGILLIPYILWLILALSLNLSILL